MTLTRRHALGLVGAGSFFSVTGLPRVSFASVPTDNRLVVVFLRGAMDGLTAVPAYGDPDFERERNGIALPPPGNEGGALDLDGFFGLSPWLPAFHQAYQDGDMLAIHAVATPYRERSHFDAQNLLENGSDRPYGYPTGWLNRAIVDVPPLGPSIGVSVTTHSPVMMRGDSAVASWSPSTLPQPSADLIARAAELYGRDPALSDTFDQARMANAAMAGQAQTQGFAALMAGAANFLKAADGPRVAFTDSSGWDTHAGQAAEEGPLWQAMTGLNAGLDAFRQEIGDLWSKTAILFVTEFGRTIAMNGSNGTDHGTGGAAFLVGGAVAGGRVIADWPGLKKRDQYEGRDLMPTMDLRSVAKGLLREQLGVSDGHLESAVFPDSREARPLEGLVRT